MIEFLFFINIIIFFIAGYILIKGADHFINGAENIGTLMKISPFVVGVFILGLGTSLPEVVSSVFAMLQGETSLPASIVIGSNIANLLLVFGVMIIFAKGIKLTTRLADTHLPIMSSVLLLLVLVGYDGSITTAEGMFLLAGTLIYILFSFSNENKIQPLKTDYDTQDKRFHHLWKDCISIVGGLIAVVIGGHFLIDSTSQIAYQLGISSELIGLTLIAIGTSLPEAIVSLKAVLKGNTELAVGNIIGSTILNTTLILGITTLFGETFFDIQTYSFAFPFMIGTYLVIIVSGITNRISIWEGLFFLITYAVFISKIAGII